MQVELQSVVEKAREAFAQPHTRPEFEAEKARFVGPNGELTALMKRVGQAPKEERPALGKLINSAKTQIQEALDAALAALDARELAAQIGPPIDPTLPSPDGGPGTLHPLTLVREEICRIFRKAGFAVVEGTEVETEWFAFDALNTPADHPARDLQDTFYLAEGVGVANVSRRESERYVLRPHTSTVQIRTLLKQKPPIRIISPGRTFRRDTTDATHSANFHQIEGFYVDRHVTVKDLKAVLDYLFRSLLGNDVQTRFRPHYFGYTEPSFEVDLSAKHLGKVGKDWIEIMGCGVVDPTVFEGVGLDPNEWTGYAFGMGIERVAMLLYGVDDIRYFYQNDVRFLRQFS
jgi:phenylalanyl-tRNA synthetase alpha chain